MSQEIPALHRLEVFLIKINEDWGIFVVHTARRLITCFLSATEALSGRHRGCGTEDETPPRCCGSQTAFVGRRKEHVSPGG